MKKNKKELYIILSFCSDYFLFTDSIKIFSLCRLFICENLKWRRGAQASKLSPFTNFEDLLATSIKTQAKKTQRSTRLISFPEIRYSPDQR